MSDQLIFHRPNFKVCEVAVQNEDLTHTQSSLGESLAGGKSWSRSMYAKMDVIRLPFKGLGRLSDSEKMRGLLAMQKYLTLLAEDMLTKIEELGQGLGVEESKSLAAGQTKQSGEALGSAEITAGRMGVEESKGEAG